MKKMKIKRNWRAQASGQLMTQCVNEIDEQWRKQIYRRNSCTVIRWYRYMVPYIFKIQFSFCNCYEYLLKFVGCAMCRTIDTASYIYLPLVRRQLLSTFPDTNVHAQFGQNLASVSSNWTYLMTWNDGRENVDCMEIYKKKETHKTNYFTNHFVHAVCVE